MENNKPNKIKIKISEFETYVLNMPEELDEIEFIGLVDRLNLIKKVLLREPSISDNIQEPRIIKKVYKKFMPTSRESVKEALKIHFFGDIEEKIKFLQKENLTGNWSNCVAGKFGWMKVKYNLNPEEFGLTRFPRNKLEFGQMEMLKIKDEESAE